MVSSDRYTLDKYPIIETNLLLIAGHVSHVIHRSLPFLSPYQSVTSNYFFFFFFTSFIAYRTLVQRGPRFRISQECICIKKVIVGDSFWIAEQWYRVERYRGRVYVCRRACARVCVLILTNRTCRFLMRGLRNRSFVCICQRADMNKA